MNLKFFGLIITVMFIALLGIIYIQWHFISNTIKLNEEQFERHVISALKQVANDPALSAVGEIQQVGRIRACVIIDPIGDDAIHIRP